MEKINKREVGGLYEQRTADYLTARGMRIIEMNYRVKIGEIDIIAADGDCLVFVEVKYRKDGGAFYAIPRSKQEKIRKVAMWFMNERHLDPLRTICRFDAVLIDGDEISHVENAW